MIEESVGIAKIKGRTSASQSSEEMWHSCRCYWTAVELGEQGPLAIYLTSICLDAQMNFLGTYDVLLRTHNTILIISARIQESGSHCPQNVWC